MLKPIQGIWILKQDGFLLYNKVIGSELDPNLFSALLSALNMFVSEISDDSLKYFELMNTRFNIDKKKGLLFVASSEKDLKPKKISKDLEMIEEIFFKKYGDVVLKDWNQDTSIFQGFDTEIIEYIEKQPKEKKVKKSRKKIKEKANKLDVIMEINDLKKKAFGYKLEGNFDDAILYSNKAIKVAIKNELPYNVEEFQEIIDSIANKIQKELVTAQITDYASWLTTQYDIMVKDNSIIQAHDMVQEFKKKYEKTEIFNELKVVKKLIDKDKREWVKYTVLNDIE